MPLLIPFIVGASATATGYWWWTSDSKKEPTFSSELLDTIKPFLIIAIILLGLRWLYKQGTATKKTK